MLALYSATTNLLQQYAVTCRWHNQKAVASSKGSSWTVLDIVVKGEKQGEEEPSGREGERLGLGPCASEEVPTLRPASDCLP